MPPWSYFPHIIASHRVIRSLDRTFGLDEEALKAVKNWRFSPGKRQGKNVAVIVEIELTFTLR